MKEIFIFAGYLGLFIVAFWMVVVFVERRLTIVKSNRAASNEEDKGDEIPVPVIIAGIKAYESCFVAEEKKIKRKIYKPKEAPVSLWKIKGRVKQIES
jgi:hypothetical protein